MTKEMIACCLLMEQTADSQELGKNGVATSLKERGEFVMRLQLELKVEIFVGLMAPSHVVLIRISVSSC